MEHIGNQSYTYFLFHASNEICDTVAFEFCDSHGTRHNTSLVLLNDELHSMTKLDVLSFETDLGGELPRIDLHYKQHMGHFPKSIHVVVV